MKPETKRRIQTFYKKEVDSISTPSLPGFLTKDTAYAEDTPANSTCIEASQTTKTSTQTSTRGSKSAPHTFQRRLASELVRIALTAAVVSGGILLPANHSVNPVSQGLNRLFTDSALQESVSRTLFDAALMLGKSIVKE